MYKVYFDNIEQNADDILNINSIISFTLIREDGITSTEQILREKTEMDLQFTGCAYDYICERIQIDKCNEIDFSVEDTDTGISFNGVINVSLCELQIAKRIGKTKIKDTSFSAYIRDIMDVGIQPFFSNTKDCQKLEMALTSIDVNYNPANQTDIYGVRGYDALSLIQYMVNYFTNNRVSVVSTYLTSNKVFLTTGIMLRRKEVNNDEIYPEFNINEVFQQLRKKYRLYMGIEYTVSGVPYLLIDEEDNFYANTPIITIQDVPVNLVQSYDLDRNFNSVKIGSETTELEEGDITYAQLRYNAWNEETYTGCGDCASDRNSILDLVSKYIIDSNIIYECINNIDDEYTHDDAIFMIEYSSGKSITTLDAVSGKYYFNDGFRNENVLNNWLGYSEKCIAVDRRAKYGFYAVNGNKEEFGTFINNDYIRFNEGDICPTPVPYTYYLGCLTEVYDNLNTLTLEDENDTACHVGYKVSVFECAETGVYEFNAGSKMMADVGTNVTDDLIDAEFNIRFVVFSDNTLTTETYGTTPTQILFDDVYINPTQVKSFNINSGLLPLSIGNCVVVEISMDSASFIGGNITYRFRLYDSFFELSYDSFVCESFDNNANSRPYIVDFDHPICAQDYILMKENKSGYITIRDNQYWIKEVTYKPGLSKFKLIGNESLC